MKYFLAMVFFWFFAFLFIEFLRTDVSGHQNFIEKWSYFASTLEWGMIAGAALAISALMTAIHLFGKTKLAKNLYRNRYE